MNNNQIEERLFGLENINFPSRIDTSEHALKLEPASIIQLLVNTVCGGEGAFYELTAFQPALDFWPA